METIAACRFFQTPRGCLRGDSCTFRHDKNDAPPATSNYPPSSPGANDLVTAYSPGNPYASGVTAPCRFFLTEAGCRNGVACPFAHIGAAPTTYAPPPPMGYSPMDGGIAAPSMLYGGPMTPSSAQMMAPPPPLLLSMEYSMEMTSLSNPPTPTGGNGTGVDEHATAGSKPRRKLHIQANPSKSGNYEVISEIMPVLTREIEGPFFAIDVECVATGIGVDDRDVARIAIVNEDEEVAYDRYVLPDKPIVSYLTQLTGISQSHLVGAPSLAEALVELRKILPCDSVIVGQSIKKDLEWLGLQKEADFKSAFDVADLFRIPMQSKNGTIRYRYFSLRHVAKYLLGHDIQEADHDPVIDAKYAMKIFKQFRHLHESPGRRDAVYQTLLQTPRTPSFAERYPIIDGVLMRIPRKPREYHYRSHHHHAHHGDHQHVHPAHTYMPDPTLMT